MSTPLQAETHSWNGLRKLEAALPASWYFDATQHELELHKIWYRNWIYVCRADQLTEPLEYVTYRIGTQTALVLRDESGELRAFHNTCRHRGSALCLESAGRLPTRAITCRYHGWSYNLRGELLRTPAFGRAEPAGLRELGLYGVQLRNWNGFVFINLSPTDQRPLETGFIGGADPQAYLALPINHKVCSSSFGYEKKRSDILEAAAQCHIGADHDTKRLVVDDVTYHTFLKIQYEAF